MKRGWPGRAFFWFDSHKSPATCKNKKTTKQERDRREREREDRFDRETDIIEMTHSAKRP